MLAEATYRRGITDFFTLEGHGEFLEGNSHALGLNAAFGIGKIGVINVTAATAATQPRQDGSAASE